MSFDTTAKPRPASPARAASTEPLTASMVVWTTISEMPDTIFSMLRPTDSRRAIVLRLARVLSRPVATPATSFATAPLLCLRSSAILATRSLRLDGVFLRPLGAPLDLAEGRRGLLRRGGLLLGSAVDLAQRRHDLSRGARQLLDGGRQLLGGRADLLGGREVHPAGAGGFRDPRQLLRGRLALLERLGLLLHRRLRLAGGRRLFFGRAGDQGCALFRLGRGAIGLQRFGQGLLAAVGDLLHVLAQAVQALDGGGAGLRFVDGGFGRLLQGGGDLAHVGLDRRGELLHLLRALLGGLGERAHFVGDDREAAAVIAGARRFDRGVQRQEIGLVGDAADRAR